GEVAAPFDRKGREQADRGETRDGVDLGQVDPIAGDEEVDPGEALGAYGAIGVAGDLQDGRPDRARDLRPDGGPGQTRRVLRRVVVELVAGEDLAGSVQLEPGVIVADDAHLEVARAGEVGLGQGDVVVAERLIERRRQLGRVVDEGDPDRRA